ncbi:MAG TPA: hypothetical protein VJ550_02425 [Geomonas sp.]|nr:hypothetical protein [Geomonas sp.]
MKKKARIALATLTLLLAYALPGQAHVHGGVYIGPYWPAWPVYPYPYVYPQQPIVIEQGPTEYMQQPQSGPEQQFWYYCSDPQGYYPYVQRCPKGWKKVVPATAPPETEE